MRRVGLVTAGPEGVSARAWLESLPEVAVTVAGRLEALALEQMELVWVHGVRVEPATALLPWLRAGGRLLLSLDAVELPAQLGLEQVVPDEWHEARWRPGHGPLDLEDHRSFPAHPHLRGLAAFGPHPLFRGLQHGVYTWAPTEAEAYRWLVYRARRPAGAAGVAVERSALQLHPERLVAWEYEVGDGGILCLGAFIYLAARDGLQASQLRAMLSNAVRGDAVPHASRNEAVSHWPGSGLGAAVSSEGSGATPPVVSLGEVWDEWPPSASPLLIESTARTDHPWTLAGRRALAIGGERRGLSEVWVHPYRVLRAVRLLVGGQSPEVSLVKVAPDEIVRVLRVGDIELTERVTTGLDQGLVFWSIVADAPVPISFEWLTDLRRSWPYPAAASRGFLVAHSPAAIRVGLTDEPQMAEVRAVDGEISRWAELSESGRMGVRIEACGNRLLRLVFAAGGTEAELSRAIETLRRRKLRALRQERLLHARRLEDRLTGLDTPDAGLNRGFGWAKVRVDSFLAESPAAGRSLMAGYGGSRPGWADGRAGFSWYFSRDACWTAFATLAMGDREIAKDTLRFLARTQAANGKVAHECSTSGLIDYDAADSTPLFLLLAARYAAWSGDFDTMERLWPQILSAYRYCLSTDRDDDGLIENHGVGHGWIAHGPLGGLEVTLYLAACWLAALEGLAPVAHALDAGLLAEELVERGERARQAIRRRFRVGDDYALGLERDGRPRMHRTALLAVPLLLGAVDAREVPAWFDAIAGEDFTAPWGVRLIPKSDPLFDARGYDQGTIWPLYTGWVSLAEWRGGRWEAALAHWKSNAGLASERAKGAFDEVLHGLERTGAGTCPDQAWSAAMVIAPAIEGLWGVVPDALNHTVQLSPYLPQDWNDMALHRLRVGPTTLDLRLRRRPGRFLLKVARAQGPRIRIAATLRSAGPVKQLTVDDEPLGGGRAVFEADTEHEVQFVVGDAP